MSAIEAIYSRVIKFTLCELQGRRIDGDKFTIVFDYSEKLDRDYVQIRTPTQRVTIYKDMVESAVKEVKQITSY